MKDEMYKIMEHAICQWCYGKDCKDVLHHNISLGESVLWYSKNAFVQKASTASVEVVIVGECIDVTGEMDSDKIANFLCEFDSKNFESAIENLCGVYVVFRCESGRVTVYGDAMRMMSVYYGVGVKSGIVASCEALITDCVEPVSVDAKEVLAGAYEGGLYLAGDMTMYDDVKALLPNHCLVVNETFVRRYFPREDLVTVREVSDIENIIDSTNRLVTNTIRQFSKKMKFASPLTPGADSRVNCAFLNSELPRQEVLYYVIRNNEFVSPPENETLVKRIAASFGFDDFHFYPEVEAFSHEFVESVEKVFGPTRPWGRKVWAYHPAIKDRAVVSGAMIGHILGGTLGRNMPRWIIGPWFVKVAQRNISKIAARETDKWYCDAENAVQKGYSILDLWSWEIRCGRWNANTASRNNIYGIRNINFYNSHKIISEWCRIPRRLRVRKNIHKRILEKIAPSVANIVINPYINKYSTHIPVFLIRFVPLWVRAIGVHMINKWKLGHE